MPREGHKFSSWSIRSLSTHFNPRAPRGARLPMVALGIMLHYNFNPRAPRGARLNKPYLEYLKDCISIHVPREGHDDVLVNRLAVRQDFNPRAPRGARLDNPMEMGSGSQLISIHVPREGHDRDILTGRAKMLAFQSTCPARGTTTPLNAVSSWSRFQSTCPARGTTLIALRLSIGAIYFNPRAPRGARLQNNRDYQ